MWIRLFPAFNRNNFSIWLRLSSPTIKCQTLANLYKLLFFVEFFIVAQSWSDKKYHSNWKLCPLRSPIANCNHLHFLREADVRNIQIWFMVAPLMELSQTNVVFCNFADRQGNDGHFKRYFFLIYGQHLVGCKTKYCTCSSLQSASNAFLPCEYNVIITISTEWAK